MASMISLSPLMDQFIIHQGKEYARVSNIINPYLDLSHIPPDVLKRKAELGTQVHKAISDEIQGSLPCPGKNGMGYFQSFIKWKQALVPKFTHLETRYFDEEKRITGQIDCVVLLPGDKQPVLVDFKTSAQESPISWPMQGHLYDYVLERNGISIAPRYLFLKLDKFGDVPTVYEYKFSRNIFSKCMIAIDDFWKKIRKDQKR